MCILFIYAEPNPQPNAYRLVIIANRDEFYARPAELISRTNDVIGGSDMENSRKGGMWLGISVQQTDNLKLRFGALLNVTGENRKHGSKGRGFIVSNYLDKAITANDYMNLLLKDIEEYNGYNFVAVELNDNEITTHHCSNVTKSYTRYEKERILGFGNTTPEIPLKKVLFGKKQFKEIIDENNSIDQKTQLLEKLLELLKYGEKHLPDPELEKRQPAAYQELSCVFVKIMEAGYGTRTHSIILVDYDWNIEFFEATMREPINIEDPFWLNSTIKARL